MNAEEKPKTSLLSHFAELKSRLLVVLVFYFAAVLFCYHFVEHIYHFLVSPLLNLPEFANHHFIYTNLTEAFFTSLKLALYTAFIITLPFALAQTYLFAAPALYKNEKRFLLPYFIFIPVLFLAGAFFVYYVVFPVAWKFFLNFELNYTERAIPIQFEAKISEYLTLVTQLVISFGLAFQLPVIMTLLVKFRILTTEALLAKRRYAVVFIFIVAAILTPPDVLSQIALAIPMVVLYEISLVACKLIEKKENNLNA